MKKILFAAIALVTFGFTKKLNDIVTELGISQYHARLYVVSNFVGDFTNDGATIWNDNGDGMVEQMDHFKTPSVKNLAAFVTGDKVTAAKDLCDWVKMYVNSEEFMADYLAKREKAKPTREPYHPSDEQMKDMRENIRTSEKDLADMKKNKVGAEYIHRLEEVIAGQKAKLADDEQPNYYITRWNKGYPEDPAIIIRERLNEYLALAATVDFNATVTSGRLKKFTNPAYEKKSIKWKAIYRAGKEVNTVVTAFVKEWLKGEIIAANKIKMPKEAAAKSTAPVKSGMGSTSNGGDNGNNTAGANTGSSKAGEQTGNTSDAGNADNSTADPAAPVKKVKKAAFLLKRLKEKID